MACISFADGNAAIKTCPYIKSTHLSHRRLSDCRSSFLAILSILFPRIGSIEVLERKSSIKERSWSQSSFIPTLDIDKGSHRSKPNKHHIPPFKYHRTPPIFAPYCKNPTSPLKRHRPLPPSPLWNKTLLLLAFHKLQRLLPTHNHHIRALLLIPHPVAFLRHVQHLRPKGRAYELRSPFSLGAASLVTDVPQVLRYGGAVLSVEVRVDFVEEVEGCGVALLDCEDEGEGAETWLRGKWISLSLSPWRGKGGCRRERRKRKRKKRKRKREREREKGEPHSSAHRSTVESAADRRACY